MTTKTAEADQHSEFEEAVLAGFALPQKSIPCRFLYDERGSDLFEQITQLDEYYPTRTEVKLLNAERNEIARAVGPGVALVELGSGSSTKTEILIEGMSDLAAYVPVEISESALAGATAKLSKKFPDLKIFPVCADFSNTVSFPDEVRRLPKFGFFPGSTIGNFEPDQAVSFLSTFRKILGENGFLLIGVDLDKSPDILLPAYNDASNVTAEFIMNILNRINRELDGNFDRSKFSYVVQYNEQLSRVEMFIQSEANQSVQVSGNKFFFNKSERIFVEYSHKYSVDSFLTLANDGGWRSRKYWIDEDNLFSIHLLEASSD
ncbi:MAG: L-histidine N(alpha)-methyltransferase [Methyloligellaceae bacterium]